MGLEQHQRRAAEADNLRRNPSADARRRHRHERDDRGEGDFGLLLARHGLMGVGGGVGAEDGDEDAGAADRAVGGGVAAEEGSGATTRGGVHDEEGGGIVRRDDGDAVAG